MEITLRLHPTLRDQLREAAENPHRYREWLERLAAEAKAVVRRHGPALTYAPLAVLGTPLDEAGAAMSAFAPRPGAVVIEIDPLGTAIGERVVLWQPRIGVLGRRPARAPAVKQPATPRGPLTLRPRTGDPATAEASAAD